MTTTPPGKFIKRAFVRIPNDPAHMGQIACPCGRAPRTSYHPQPEITCQCGRVYTWDGWIVNDTPTYPPLTAFKVTYHDGESYTTSMAPGITLAEARDYLMQDAHIMPDEITRKWVVNVEQLA